MTTKSSQDCSVAIGVNCFIRHNYHDHATVTMYSHLMSRASKIIVNDNSISRTDKNRVNSVENGRKHSGKGFMIRFPTKLHMVLSIAENDGFDDIVSWQAHGRCFFVRKPREFVDKILSSYFGQSKIASFQRQLSMYGFLRLTQGPDRGCYYHELFLKHKLYLCQDITRTGVNGNVVKRRVDPKTEPDFYSMPFVAPDPELPEYLLRFIKKEEPNEPNNGEGSSNITF
mmetsp:Transcript_732/g.1425  ORF Transcript_732/g.1425 Transcript_732/m.1425 type:complete len:228 (+) Transcript_732:118-801(+)